MTMNGRCTAMKTSFDRPVWDGMVVERLYEILIRFCAHSEHVQIEGIQTHSSRYNNA